MTLLNIVKEFFRRTGIREPQILFSSKDLQLIQVIGLANEVVEDLSLTRKQWTAQEREASFLALATEVQRPLTEIAPGFLWMVDESFFNRTTKLKIEGPMSASQWQAAKSVTYASAYSQFRFVGNELRLYPAPAINDVLAFEYRSNYLIRGADNTYKQYFSADDDEFVLDPSLLIAGLRAFWKKDKGLASEAEYRSYERLVQNFSAHDKANTELSMNGSCQDRRPGIFIPDSDYTL